jgi:TolB protein
LKVTDNQSNDFHPSWSSDGRTILYDSKAGDSSSVRAVSLDGRYPRDLGSGDHPYWVPGGEYVTLIQYLDDGVEVVALLNLDSGTARPITRAAGRNGAGFPSPDGKSIAFMSNRDGDWELMVVPTEGGDQLRLTDNDASEFFGSWSPDGSMIAFQSNRDGNWDGYVVNVESGQERRLTSHEADDGGFLWSPDGERIAFTSSRDGHSELYWINADGTGLRRLTQSQGDVSWPSWSPDAQRIAYAVSQAEHTSVDVVVVESGEITRVVAHPSRNVAPDWSPDGCRLAFVSDRDGDFEIYVADAQGTRRVQ